MRVEIKSHHMDMIEYAKILKRSPVRDIPGAGRTLAECLTMSEEVFVGEIGGEPACVWGLIPPTILSDSAYLWLLCTDVVTAHQFIFIRHSQIVMERLLKIYPTIVGRCVVGQSKTIRWLKWLGAEFQYHGGPTLSFTIKARHG